MAHPASWTTGAALVLVAALVGSAACLTGVREARYPAPVVDDQSLYLTSGAAARRLTMGYNALAADLYWIRAIQHYGDVKLRLARERGQPAGPRGDAPPPAYDRLHPLLDLATTLDPEFNIAYRFGAIFLAEAYPGGAGRPDLAIALLEKGIRARPDKWEYMQDIGFVHYWWLHDYQAASRWFDRASQVEGAPWFLRSLAATTLAEGGDRRSSRLMWQTILASAENDWLKGDAERRLRQLDAADFVESLQRVVDRHAEATGQRASDWRTLIRDGVLPGVPTDPTGTPYEISPTGAVDLSSRSPLFPLPDEPQRLSRPPVS
jgi:tetratricopeptide (TPR) repeat protein